MERAKYDAGERRLLNQDEAYSLVYQKHIDELFSYGMRFTRDRDIVKDCIHDVFVKLYGRSSALMEIRHMRAYLLASLRNELFSVLKRDNMVIGQGALSEFELSVDFTAEESLIAHEQRSEQQRKIGRALNMLTPRQKEVIYYRYTMEMKMPQICQIMGINYQSLQNLMQRSILKIRQTIDCPQEKKAQPRRQGNHH